MGYMTTKTVRTCVVLNPIAYYNGERSHSSLQYLTPVEASAIIADF